MAGLWRKNPETPEGKYLVKRRDGTVPAWPFFVIAASDPAAPRTLRAYADAAEVGATDGDDRTGNARRRAADDHEVIMRALTWAQNGNVTLANGVTVVQIAPAGDEADGAQTIDDTGNGLVLSRAPLLVTVQISPLTAWELGA